MLRHWLYQAMSGGADRFANAGLRGWADGGANTRRVWRIAANRPKRGKKDND